MRKTIIGLVGEIASGKGTVAEYLKKEHGAEVVKFSTPMRDVLKRLYREITRSNMQGISLKLRELFGQDLFAQIITEDVNNSKNDLLVVDGIRREEDIKYLKDLDGFHLVYITADIETRYQRIIQRNENSDDREKTFEDFQRDHLAETEISIPLLGEKAKFRIDNKGTIEQLKEQADLLIQNFKK